MASWAKTDIRDCLTRAFQRISERTGYTMKELEEFVGSIETLIAPPEASNPKKSKINVVKPEEKSVFETVTLVVKKPGKKKSAFYSPTVDQSKPVPQSVEDLFPTRIPDPIQQDSETVAEEQHPTTTVKEEVTTEQPSTTTVKEEVTKEQHPVATVKEEVAEEQSPIATVTEEVTKEQPPTVIDKEEGPSAPVSIKRKRPRIRVNREEEEQTTQTVAGFEITRLEQRKSSNIRDADYQKLVEHHFELIGAGEEVVVHRRRIAGTEYYVTDKGGYVYPIGSDGSVNLDRLIGKIDDLDDEHIIMY